MFLSSSVLVYADAVVSSLRARFWLANQKSQNLELYLIQRRTSLVVQMVKNLPAMKETWVRFLGQEVPLEKGMATHSSILAWKIPWPEEPGGLQSMGSQRVGHD